MRGSTLLLIGLCGLTFFVGLGGPAISDTDEAFYAEAGREMVESGDWLTPHFNYTERFQKPILFYWMVSTGFELLGVTETAARIGSALSGLGLVLLAAACGRRYRDASTGAIAGAIVATSFGCMALARTALPEMPLAFFITAAIAAGLSALSDAGPRRTSSWALAAAAAGFAVLAKGPIGVVLPVLVLLPVVLTGRRWRRLKLGTVCLAAAVFLAVAAPWYGLMAHEHGVAYLKGFFLGDNLERFATARFNDPRPPWFYVPIVLGGLLPWSPFLSLAIPSAWKTLTRKARLAPAEWQFVLWALLPFLLFTLSVGKQPRYILPVLPPLAVLLAGLISARLDPNHLPGHTGRVRLFRASGVVSGLLLAVLGALILRTGPLLIEADPATMLASVAIIVGAGLTVAVLALTSRWSWTPAALAVAAAVTVVIVQSVVLTRQGADPVEQMAREVLVARRGGERVGCYGVFVRNLVFYTHAEQVDLFSETARRDFLASPDRVLCVLSARDLDRAEREQRTSLVRLATLRYFDPMTAKLRTLISPDMARDLQTVVLVSNR